MYKRIVSILVILISSIYCWAQNICTINGVAPELTNQKVILYTISDYFSYQLKELAISQTDAEGKFTLKVDSKNGFKSFIQIQDKRGVIYIDPNTAQYNITFPNKLNDDIVKKLNNNNVQLMFHNLSQDDLNVLILEFNNKFDHFLYGDSIKISRLMHRNQDFRDSLTQFTKQIYTYYSDVKNRYFTDFVKYSIASIALFSDAKEHEKNKFITFETFIKNKPILYHNDAYMEFVKEFYKNLFSDISMMPRDKTTFAINKLKSLDQLNEVAAANIFLSNATFREFVFLNAFSETFHNTYFNLSNIQFFLSKIAKETTHSEHKQIALNILKRQTDFLAGSDCPEFEIITTKGDTLYPQKFKDKYVYIHFWASWNAPSIQDMMVIKMLHEKYNKYVAFISISLDENDIEFNKFIAKHKDFKWHIAHYKGDASILNNFDIRNIPLYVLIDNKGQINQFPALAPSPSGTGKSIDETLHYIKRKLEPQNNARIGHKGY